LFFKFKNKMLRLQIRWFRFLLRLRVARHYVFSSRL
jgi:hypothetical protein